MVHLPYIPPPYPDEILGSWLARISLHNGQGAWQALLESTGNGLRLRKPHFDLLDYDDKIEKLLNALGTGYEQAMIELTTLPYWLAFDAVSDEKLPGTTAIPRLINPQKQALRGLRGLGIGRSNQEALQPHYCPQCLDQDRMVCGEPYWHRSHQLPNVFFCPEHQYPLQTVCPVCSAYMVTVSSRLIDLPRLQCSCGNNFRLLAHFKPPPRVYLLLTQISVQALNCTQLRWDYKQVRMYLRSLLDAHANSHLGQYESALSATFDMTPDAVRRLYAKVPWHSNSGPRLWLQRHFRRTRAPECCALLVSMGVDFKRSTLGFQQATIDASDNAIKLPFQFRELTVNFARRDILRRVAVYPNLSPSDHKNPYWFLRINDPQWLKERFPGISRSPIPNIQDDRKSIIDFILSNNTALPRKLYHRVMNKPASVRAKYRDRDWYDQQLDQLLQFKKGKAAANRNTIDKQRASAMADALQKLLQEEDRPRHIFPQTLAATAGLSQSQAGDIYRTHQHLRDTIAAVNDDWPRRKLLWAARQLQATGLSLTVGKICERANFPSSNENRKLVQEIIAMLEQSSKIKIR